MIEYNNQGQHYDATRGWLYSILHPFEKEVFTYEVHPNELFRGFSRNSLFYRVHKKYASVESLVGFYLGSCKKQVSWIQVPVKEFWWRHNVKKRVVNHLWWSAKLTASMVTVTVMFTSVMKIIFRT